jgi:WS/DGAT/MGAT family acyltransferase
MVDRMSPLDAAFLDIEDEDPHASLAIASVAVIEGPAPSHEEFVAAIRARLPLVPRYRQRAWQVPFDLGHPVWADDPHFDLTYHVRRTALPAAGDDQALCRLVARIMSQRLDRERPLWEYWVVEGLAGGRWALISKVHHCMVDGVSGTHLYHLLCDASAEGTGDLPEDTWKPAGDPTALRLVADALLDLVVNPMEQMRLAGRALRSPRATAARVGETVRGLATLVGALRPAVASSLVGPIGRQRRYAIARAPLEDLVGVGRRAQVSLNDVALAAISGAFRTILCQRGEEPDPRSVRTLVPVSVRHRGDEDMCDNRISMLLAFLPVHLADPQARLRAVHRHLTELKASKEAQAGEAMTTLARHEPFPPISWGMRMAARLPQRNIITVATNVPGPRQPLYLLGRQLVEILPYVPIATRLRTGVSIFTYCDQVTFGITGDYDTAADVAELARGIEAGIAELVAAHRPTPAPRRPGVAAKTRARASSRPGA